MMSAHSVSPADWPAWELRARYRRGEVRPTEVVRAVLERIAAVEPRIHAYLYLDADAALGEAARWDAIAGRDDAPPLAGVPVALKDNLCTRGVPTTAGSRILDGFRPPYDATVVVRLRDAGAVVLGKTNCDEFAMGSSTENSGFGPTRNPWDPTRVPGGSSGGSAAAVAAGEATLALGSDTGGSIREPGAFCGVVGLKPTYGRVSRYGLIAFASSLDQIGPFARDVRDAALLLRQIAGRDPADATSADVEVPDYAALLTGRVDGLRLGVVREFLGEGVDPGVASAIRAAIRTLEGLGAQRVDVSLPHAPYALPAYYLVAPAEASSNLARYAGVLCGRRTARDGDLIGMYARTRDEGFGAEVKRRIMLGTYALSAGYYDAFYLRAQRVRELIRREFEDALNTVDVLVGPVAPTPAFPLGERVEDPLQMYLADVFTVPINLAGLPGVSVPCGFAGALPVGLQIVGRAFDEATVLNVAYALEQAIGTDVCRPPIVAETRSPHP
ncbi:MAG TPA: Asp-tRNA(Asn)/Glu-tRNA(Gln) amidotransferase subunit GatA [bacterium]|nr:Asp-tRNA(Asn)/Glu-tRNA(Gln) amidotransferase subunit GatA [bacterium]